MLKAAVVATAFCAGYLLYHQGHRSAQTGDDGQAVETGEVLPQATVGARRPDFAQRDVQGMVRRMDEWDGSAVVLNFWASWCPPCRTEIPWFINMQAQYRQAGLQFVGIAMQDAEETTDFIEEHGINYPVLAGTRATLELMARYGNDAGALPYTVFIDRDGIITRQHYGPLSREQLRRMVQKLLLAGNQRRDAAGQH